MKDKFFVDTNVFVYASLEDRKNIGKRDKAVKLLQNISDGVIISTQVINELYNVMLRNDISDVEIQVRIDEIIEDAELVIVTIDTIKHAWKIRKNYNYSYWDSLILVSALESECNIFYSEDLQDNQLVEHKLKILNAFK